MTTNTAPDTFHNADLIGLLIVALGTVLLIASILLLALSGIAAAITATAAFTSIVVGAGISFIHGE